MWTDVWTYARYSSRGWRTDELEYQLSLPCNSRYFRHLVRLDCGHTQFPIQSLGLFLRYYTERSVKLTFQNLLVSEPSNFESVVVGFVSACEVSWKGLVNSSFIDKMQKILNWVFLYLWLKSQCSLRRTPKAKSKAMYPMNEQVIISVRSFSCWFAAYLRAGQRMHRVFSSPPSFHTGTGGHPARCLMCTGCPLPDRKAAGVWSEPPTRAEVKNQWCCTSSLLDVIRRTSGFCLWTVLCWWQKSQCRCQKRTDA